MIIARTERLVIRNWRETDRGLFFEINSDPEVMEFFAMRRTREESDALFDRNREAIQATGYGFSAVALAATDEAIGFCGLAYAHLAPFLADDAIEIGWRLTRRHWSKGYVTEAARALLDVGFNERGLDEIVSFAVKDNYRSIAVMERLGMTRGPNDDFDHPRVPDTHPHLKRHVLYRISSPDTQHTVGSGA